MTEFSEFEEKIAYKFKNKGLLIKALTHPSIVSNKFESEFERLEFLGDRVLGLSIAELLFKKHSTEAEGDLAKRLAVLVSRDKLLEIGEEIGIRNVVRAYRADMTQRSGILADAIEAILGAIFLDSSYETAKQTVMHLWAKHIEAANLPPRDPKTTLQEWVQSRGLAIPNYKIIERTGPDHAPEFLIELTVAGQKPQRASGLSRRRAEQIAAEQMLKSLGILL